MRRNRIISHQFPGLPQAQGICRLSDPVYYREIFHRHKGWVPMEVNAPPRIPREDLERLRTCSLMPNLTKIPLFFGI